MGAIRMNISLPEKVAKKLRKSVKPRERSAVIAEALELYFAGKSQNTLIQEMIEGYKATAKEDSELAAELDSTIGDGLDDEY